MLDIEVYVSGTYRNWHPRKIERMHGSWIPWKPEVRIIHNIIFIDSLIHIVFAKTYQIIDVLGMLEDMQ